MVEEGSVLERIQLITLRMFLDPTYSFWGALLMSLPISRNDAIGTAGIGYDKSASGPTIFYSEPFFKGLDDSQVTYILLHEIDHWINLHPWRRESRHPTVFNFAADRIINSGIEETRTANEGLKPKRPIPDLFLLEDGSPGTWTAIEAYDSELKKYSSNPQAASQLGKIIQGAVEDGKPTQQVGNHSHWDDMKKRVTEEEAKTQVARHCEAAQKAASRMPRKISRLLEGFKTENKLQLQDYVRPWCRGVIKRKKIFTWARPHRVYGEDFPGQTRVQGPSVGYVFDVSASFSDNEIREVMSEALFLSNRYGAYYVQADTEIKEPPRKFKPKTILRSGIKRLGQGGTNMNPAIEYFMKDKRVGAVIVFTDGHLYNDVNTDAITKPLLFVISSKGSLLGDSPHFSQVQVPR